MELEKALQSFGLNEKEARVYLAALELGSAPASLIARRARVARSSCYNFLESLQEVGVISNFQKKKIRYFSAEDPKKIIHLAQTRTRDLEKVGPQLEALYGLARERPRVRFFQGKDGMKQVFEEVLEDKHEYLSFGSAEDLFTALDDYYPEFVERRVREKILARVILRDSPKARERQRLGPKQLRVVKILPARFEHHGMVSIFGNKIAFFSFLKDYLAVIIESKELVAIQRNMFEFIWQQL